jgi:hypothetical protein
MREFLKRLAVLLLPETQILIEHPLPGARMNDGRLGNDAVHVEDDRIKIQHGGIVIEAAFTALC